MVDWLIDECSINESTAAWYSIIKRKKKKVALSSKFLAMTSPIFPF
jgi:hypothetical protein